MLLVIAFHTGDAPQALNLCKLIGELGGCGDHKLLLVADASVDWFPASEIAEAARPSFASTELIVSDPSVTGWPLGANALWLCAARHVMQNKLGPWLWLEPDAVPLCKGWLDQIANAKFEKPFAGHIYRDNQTGKEMISGIAVYPQDAYRWKEVVQQRAFDVALSDFVMNEAQHTNLIYHLWGENNLPPTFVRQKTQLTPRNAMSIQEIPPQAVVFHRNKDGTLIRLLREKLGIKVEPEPLTRDGRWTQDLATRTPQAPSQGGGGGALGTSGRPVVVRRSNALGDALAATCVAKALKEMGYAVTFQSHPNCHCILKRVPYIDKVEEPRGSCDINLDGAYEVNPHRRQMHFAQMFIEHANHGPVKLPPARNFAPRMILEPHELVEFYEVLKSWPKPWTMICPRSDSHLNRTIPDQTWMEAADKIVGTKFWIGRHPAPPNIVDLGCRHFDNTIRYLGLADLLVTVDTGPMHVAAALGVPVVAIEQQSDPELHLSDQVDFVKIRQPFMPCLNCQDLICHIHSQNPPCQKIDPGIIATAANKKLEMVTTDGVSAIVAVWNPKLDKLNRCLEALLPQVQEIIVTSELRAGAPSGMIQNGKIRVVQHRHSGIGYGRNANFGARHSSNKWLAFVNDDCYLQPGVIEHLKSLMRDDVGIVGHLLRYPDGKIQHGGTYRNPGDLGFGHVDHFATETRYKEPLEMENVTGASILVRREAFYQVGGFDEEYGLYCEDTDFCMKMRQAGWKIMFTPLALGIHDEHSSTFQKPEVHQIMARSHAIFGRKWKWYFDKNKWVVPGSFA